MLAPLTREINIGHVQLPQPRIPVALFAQRHLIKDCKRESQLCVIRLVVLIKALRMSQGNWPQDRVLLRLCHADDHLVRHEQVRLTMLDVRCASHTSQPTFKKRGIFTFWHLYALAFAPSIEHGDAVFGFYLTVFQ